jgi:hypothetical protein
VSYGQRDAAVRLLGSSNGASWEIDRWASTDHTGSFSTSGTFADGTEGAHTLRVEIGGLPSNTFHLSILNCKPEQ